MADDQMGQDEIEQLLKKAQEAAGDGGATTPTPPAEDSKSAAAEVHDTPLDQSEIEQLLSGGPVAAPPAASPSTAAAPSRAGASNDEISQGDIEALLNQTEAAIQSYDAPPSAPPAALPPGVQPFQFADFASGAANTESATLDLMRDVQLDLTIELGRTHMHLEDVLRLKKGAVVPLDKLAGDPADIYVNGRLVARGEVLVLNDNFCVRVAELVRSENAA
ncbi:MAG: flagellar motor switch protein FliN [Planctomycetaceae bacterium]|nr:flagellar motor switch protein FliN [Planctomycetaceae bacterium]